MYLVCSPLWSMHELLSLGLPSWKGVRYPYLAPAGKHFEKVGELERTLIGAFRFRLGV
jgi:hypothetical protein